MKKHTKRHNLPHALDVALGARIKAVRLAQVPRVSQQWVALECGISFQQLQKYESGTDRISFSRLCALATALDISVPDLIAPLFTQAARPSKP